MVFAAHTVFPLDDTSCMSIVRIKYFLVDLAENLFYNNLCVYPKPF